jgi:hypothetical protein
MPEDLHRLDRPLPGTLPAVQAVGSKISLTLEPVASEEQGRNGDKSQEGVITLDVGQNRQTVPKELTRKSRRPEKALRQAKA